LFLTTLKNKFKDVDAKGAKRKERARRKPGKNIPGGR
jgi:hypothetical protein